MHEIYIWPYYADYLKDSFFFISKVLRKRDKYSILQMHKYIYYNNFIYYNKYLPGPALIFLRGWPNCKSHKRMWLSRELEAATRNILKVRNNIYM